MAKLADRFIGDRIQGKLKLRTKNLVNTDLEDDYELPASYEIEVFLGGQKVLFSDGDVAVVGSTKTDLTYDFKTAKSALMVADPKAPIWCKVHDLTGGDEPRTFRALGIFNLQAGI